ncbi:sensor histidine kinase [Streptomyces sporangiiformans]|uniref:histidine kinase n=1 Tax=Streptomyces sporangiiformans TaxID=2315329 RepID=A0A505D4J6_9ACTN|nr:sensor histidine kinase [Streptomyces sporangiiformans]TPQ16585.1 sensor histidine kinase [Streptomyces sporangiiformans]
MSRPRWLRRLPHVVVVVAAVVAAIANADEMGDRYELGVEFGTSTALVQSAAVVLALWFPVPALWLSLSATAVAAMGARPHFLPGEPAEYWPWGAPGLIAHAIVLLLLALRAPTRAAAEALALTGLLTYVIQGLIGAVNYAPTGMLAVVVFSSVVLVGTAQRGRREARTELVEQASLTAEERARRTLLEERNRIARELHDVVAHHMSVISIQAQVAPHLVENPSDELRENLDGIRQNALEALAELRRVLGVLRSENPDDPYGLGAPGTGAAPDAPQPTLDRLDVLVENTRAAGLTVTTQTSGEPLPLPPGVELSAYRIVQESLSNALRHAPGSVVRVELTHVPRGLRIRVVNSEPRHPAPPSPGAGHGLLGMRERAAMLGGTLLARETSSGGFTVVAFLPRAGTAMRDDSADDPAHFADEPAHFADESAHESARDSAPDNSTDPTGETP